MSVIMKREIKNFLKRPLFWIGVLIVVLGVFQDVRPYLGISYVSSDKDLSFHTPSSIADADITDGYVPTKEEDRRKMWEEEIQENLVSDFEMGQEEAEAVIEEMKGMDIQEACEYLETKYHYYNALYAYEDTELHQGTAEEINFYIKSKLKSHRFSYYFSRKFADFSGLYMGFFASVMLAALFWQDTRKNTYELLHTKPIRAGQYVLGKAAGGFFVCLIVLAILNLVFWAACRIFTKSSGFEVNLMDFLAATSLYILPNMLMIVCVYSLISLLFKNPLPAVPFLILYMLYSNTGSRNEEGVFGYYGRPLAIMVRFPGRFFDTVSPPMALMNQGFLILASASILLICTLLWKRRRM
ncbi:MAG: ABC transporter permease subunit [Eubacteriales bacterium]|nr:ABC transporter permease subunit [Eubacteriales bacterium]